MIDADETDLRIIAELDLNSRATCVEIGKSLSMNSNTVNNRIKELEARGIIKEYYTLIDVPSLHYSAYRIYLKLDNSGRTVADAIMRYLNRSEYAWWSGYAQGEYDIAAILWFRDNFEASGFFIRLKERFGTYMRRTVVVPLIGFKKFNVPFSRHYLGNRAMPSIIGSGAFHELDSKDKNILRMLSSDARATYRDIGRRTGLCPNSIRMRMGRLCEKKIITGFRTMLDMERLGYKAWKIDFYLESMADLNPLEQHVAGFCGTSSFIRTIGWADLEARVYAKSRRGISRMLSGVKDEFSGRIRKSRCTLYPRIIREWAMPGF